MKRLLLNTVKNDFIILAAGFLAVVVISLCFGKESSSGPSTESLKNPAIKSSQVINELGVTVVEFKNGITCVVPFNKKSLSCTQKAGFIPTVK